MISYLKGKLILKKENFVIIENNNIGYQVFVSKKILDKIPEKRQEIELFCHLEVGERNLDLYGLLNYEELEFFKILRNISGIGPKTALDICSIDSPEKIKQEIEKGNEKIFNNVSGIGAKKAKKIILELSGKLKTSFSPIEQKADFSQDETFLALNNLGYSKEKIKEILSQIPQEIKDPQERIKKALELLRN